MDKVNFGENRWHIIHGGYEDIGKAALDILYGAVSRHTKYILTAADARRTHPGELAKVNPLFIGTRKSNGFIDSFINDGLFSISGKKEGYSIKVMKSIFNQDRQMIVIAGDDDNGVLYGAVDFENKYIPLTGTFMLNNGKYFNDPFQGKVPGFERVSSPCIANRAIWTWGHVIYDYEGFIDNMVRLRLNMLVIWNDFVPVNAGDVLDYAHSRGIKVIWGYSWGWGVDLDLSNSDAINECIDSAVAMYEAEYAGLGGDGIYFQSFTETTDETVNGVVIAKAVVEMVNKIGGILLERHPGLEIQFGLHATSVRNRLDCIKMIDKRISIIWEDCGSFPYHYSPAMTDGFEQTLEFSSEIASMRGRNERFGAVFKGLTCLDWTNFEHQKGRFLLGRESGQTIEKRAAEKAEYWNYVQAYWLRNAGLVLETIRRLSQSLDGRITIEALVEDGLFEERPWFPAALLAEMLWDCDAGLNELMCNAALTAGEVFA
ncbi:MAG: hypothetical protein JXB33_03435 [Clostridia bacterium]|nr:hypothetical protein [Clostridia bacterium]